MISPVFMNHALEICVDKTPLTAQCQFCFQQEGAPLHCSGKVQNLSSSQVINWVQRNNQMATKIPGFHSHTFFLLGSSEVMYHKCPRTIDDNLLENTHTATRDITVKT
jgi:hypothetical protein